MLQKMADMTPMFTSTSLITTVMGFSSGVFGRVRKVIMLMVKVPGISVGSIEAMLTSYLSLSSSTILSCRRS
jgi:hypothetical protein